MSTKAPAIQVIADDDLDVNVEGGLAVIAKFRFLGDCLTCRGYIRVEPDDQTGALVMAHYHQDACPELKD